MGVTEPIAKTAGTSAEVDLTGYSAVADLAHPHHTHGPTPFRRLIELLRPERAEVRMIFLFTAVVGLLTLASPIAVEALVNSVAFGGLIQPVVVLSVMLLACLALAAAMSALEFYVVELIQRRIFARAAARATTTLAGLADSSSVGQSPRVLANRFLEVAQIQKISATLLLDGSTMLLTTIIGMTVLAFYHPVLLAFDVGLILAVVFQLFAMSRHGVDTAVEESLAKHGVVRWFEQVSQPTTAFRSHSGRQLAVDAAAALTSDYLDARRRHFRIVFRQLIYGLALQAAALVLILGLGGWLVIAGQMTLGQLVASELIITAVTAQLAKLGKFLESFYDLMASVDKLDSLLDLPVERAGGESPRPAAAGSTLAVRSVAYRHDADRRLFSAVDFHLAPGDTLAVLAGEGRGKSILASLLVGRREPTGGLIEGYGVDLRRWDLSMLRDRVVLVESAGTVEATVLENVRLSREGITVGDVRAALAAVELLDDVLQLPGGIDSPLGLDGEPLSSGQVRRLELARALAGRPGLLLVDGVFDRLEPQRRRRIWDRIRRDYPSTVVVLTDDPEVASCCRATVRLEDSVPDESRDAAAAEDPSGRDEGRPPAGA